MTRRHREHDDRALVRAALEKAAGASEPDVSRLVEAVPSLMAEARRRRRAAAAIPPSLVLAGRARQAIPKLALATLDVVAIAATVSFLDRGAAVGASASYDSLVLTVADSSGTESNDILLEAVTKGDEP